MNNFYVYMYLRSEASARGPSGSPYYVGKGKGRRAWSRRKVDIQRPNEDRFIQIISDCMAEHDAFQLEMLLIHLHGRVDIGTGCLWNSTDGGEGSSGFKITSESRAKLVAAMKRKRGPLPPEHRAKLSLLKKGKPSPLRGRKHRPESIEKMKEIHQRMAENDRQKVVDKFLDAFYARIAMKSNRAHYELFTPAAQPQGNTRAYDSGPHL